MTLVSTVTLKSNWHPLSKKAAYSQSLPARLHLKEEILVELAFLHKYGIFTTLPFNKYASPIFAQQKPIGKHRLLVDLKKINSLISDDFINNNQPINTLVDAAQHNIRENFLQTILIAGIPLPINGPPKIIRNAGI